MSLINHLTGHFEKTAALQQPPPPTTSGPQLNVTTATTATLTSYNATAASGDESTPCGLFYLYAGDDASSGEATEINYTAIVAFLAMQACSAAMYLLMADVVELQSQVDGVMIPLESVAKTKDQRELLDANGNDRKPATAGSLPDEPTSAYESDDDVTSVYTSQASKGADGGNSDAMALVKSMFRLLRDDRTAVMMLMLTFHSGFLHSTVVGDFTRSWISCGLGKEAFVYRGFTVVKTLITTRLRHRCKVLFRFKN